MIGRSSCLRVFGLCGAAAAVSLMTLHIFPAPPVTSLASAFKSSLWQFNDLYNFAVAEDVNTVSLELKTNGNNKKTKVGNCDVMTLKLC